MVFGTPPSHHLFARLLIDTSSLEAGRCQEAPSPLAERENTGVHLFTRLHAAQTICHGVEPSVDPEKPSASATWSCRPWRNLGRVAPPRRSHDTRRLQIAVDRLEVFKDIRQSPPGRSLTEGRGVTRSEWGEASRLLPGCFHWDSRFWGLGGPCLACATRCFRFKKTLEVQEPTIFGPTEGFRVPSWTRSPNLSDHSFYSRLDETRVYTSRPGRSEPFVTGVGPCGARFDALIQEGPGQANGSKTSFLARICEYIERICKQEVNPSDSGF